MAPQRARAGVVAEAKGGKQRPGAKQREATPTEAICRSRDSRLPGGCYGGWVLCTELAVQSVWKVQGIHRGRAGRKEAKLWGGCHPFLYRLSPRNLPSHPARPHARAANDADPTASTVPTMTPQCYGAVPLELLRVRSTVSDAGWLKEDVPPSLARETRCPSPTSVLRAPPRAAAR